MLNNKIKFWNLYFETQFPRKFLIKYTILYYFIINVDTGISIKMEIFYLIDQMFLSEKIFLIFDSKVNINRKIRYNKISFLSKTFHPGRS